MTKPLSCIVPDIDSYIHVCPCCKCSSCLCVGEARARGRNRKRKSETSGATCKGDDDQKGGQLERSRQSTVCIPRASFHRLVVVLVVVVVRSSGKNDSGVAHYNFDADQPILIIFGKDVGERVCYQRCFVILPLLTNVSALPGKTRTPDIVSFQSCCIPCLENETARREIIFAYCT